MKYLESSRFISKVEIKKNILHPRYLLLSTSIVLISIILFNLSYIEKIFQILNQFKVFIPIIFLFLDTDKAKKIENEFKKVSSGINELKERQDETETKPTNHKGNFSSDILRTTIYLFALVCIYMLYIKFNLLGTVSIIGNLFSSVANLYTHPTIWTISAKSYLSIVVGYLTLTLYANILILLPFLWFEYLLKAKDNTKETTMKFVYWEAIMLIFLLIPVGTSLIWANTFQIDDTNPIDTVQTQSKSAWQNFLDGPMCYLSKTPTECSAKENSVETETKTIERYTVRLEQPNNPRYDLPILKEEKIPVIYNFETGENGILVKKIECYQGNTLLETVEINKIIIAQKSKNEVFRCSAEKLKLEQEFDEDVQIKTVLFLEVETNSNLEIPVVNYDLYIQKLDFDSGEDVYSHALENLGQGRVAALNNALKYTIENSPFPVIINSPDENDREYYVEIIFQEDNLNNLGTLTKSTLTKFEQPTDKIISIKNPPTIPYELASYKDKASLRFTITTEGSTLEEESINDVITFTTNSEFEKKGTLRLAIKDPNFVEEKDEPLIASNENSNTPQTQITTDTTTSENTQNTQNINEKEGTPQETQVANSNSNANDGNCLNSCV